MRRPWYVTAYEWELRGGWDNELRLVRMGRTRAISIAAMVATAIFICAVVTNATPRIQEQPSQLTRR